MKRYHESQERFNRIDGDNFDICMKQVVDLKQATVLEWRIRKSNSKLCIIQFYPDGQGYNIYESSN